MWVFRIGKPLPASATEETVRTLVMNATSRTWAVYVKACFDSSVLVAVFDGDHEHHAASLSLFRQFTKTEACCSVHSSLGPY